MKHVQEDLDGIADYVQVSGASLETRFLNCQSRRLSLVFIDINVYDFSIFNYGCAAMDLSAFCSRHITNQHWLAPFFEDGGKKAVIPLTVVKKIGELDVTEKRSFGQQFQAVRRTHAHYVACIPYYVELGDRDRIDTLLAKLAAEAFQRPVSALKRLEVVLYANRMKSLWKENNILSTWLAAQNVAADRPYCTTYAGYWKLQWKVDPGCTLKQAELMKLLTVVHPARTKELVAALEAGLSEFRPMQKLRNALLHSQEVSSMIERCHQPGQEPVPVYHVSFDKDTKDFSRVLSSYDREIVRYLWKILTTGYGGAADAPELTRAQMELDRLIRISMLANGFIPYLPEPNMALLLGSVHHQRYCSYITNGGLLESLALIQNANVPAEEVCFSRFAALLTEPPVRMVSDYATKARQTPATRFSEKAIQGLRGKAQTLTAGRNWCGALYWQLAHKAGSCEFYGLMNKVLKWTSALSYVQIAAKADGKWSANAARQALNTYENWGKTLRARLLNEGEPAPITDAEQARLPVVMQAMAELLDDGHSEEEARRLVRAALSAGQVEFTFLREWANLP